MGICWWASSIFGHLVQKHRLVQADPSFYLVFKKNSKNRLSQFSESSLLVATSNKQYFEEITLWEWFDVIFAQKCFSCIASRLRARQNGKMVCLAVKKRDLCSFSAFLSLRLAGTTPELVGRKLVKGVSDV